MDQAPLGRSAALAFKTVSICTAYCRKMNKRRLRSRPMRETLGIKVLGLGSCTVRGACFSKTIKGAGKPSPKTLIPSVSLMGRDRNRLLFILLQ